MSSRTIFLSRLIGLYSILAALAMVTHKEATVATVSALIRNPPVMLVLGVITLGATYNTPLKVIADGPDEAQALDAIEKLFENRFEEE